MTSERSALEELVAARLRGARPNELLELAEAAIDQATAAGDTLTLESIAAELDSAAAAQPDQEDRLRLAYAAKRARFISRRPPAVAPSEEVPVPRAAKVAFWATVLIAALTLFSILAMGGFGDTSAGWTFAYILIFLVPLGSLFVLLTGVVGLVRSLRTGSELGVVLSLVPCGIVLLLILVRIALSV